MSAMTEILEAIQQGGAKAAQELLPLPLPDDELLALDEALDLD